METLRMMMGDQWLVDIARVFVDTVCWYCAVLQ